MIENIALFAAFAAILGGVILVHELGHFVAARAGRVKVTELGLGLPPRMARLGTLMGTEITLNWIPLGGFVRPAGEYDREVVRGLAASRPLTRLGVLGAGGFANLILSILLMTLAFVAGWPDQVEVLSVEPGSPASQAGLLPADRILQADGREIRDVDQLRAQLDAASGAAVTLTIVRDQVHLETTIVPRLDPPPGHGPAGFTSTGVISRYGLGSALLRAVETNAKMVEATIRALAQVLGPDEESTIRLAGPLGLKQASDRAVRNAADWKQPFPVLYIAAWLSLAVGITNLLPLPALDGGRMLLVFIEVVRSQPLEVRVEKAVHAAGMVVLILVSLVLTARDLMDPLF